MEDIKRLDRQLVYKGHVIDVYEDTVQLPDGKEVKWDYLQHIGASAIVPVMPDGRIVFVKQFRNAVNEVTLEIPAGKRDFYDEDFYLCAMRELKEETGATCEELIHLMRLNTTIAFCSEVIEIYVAFIDKSLGSQQLDEDEYIDKAFLTVDEAVEMIYDGRITDSKTMAAILGYKDKFCK